MDFVIEFTCYETVLEQTIFKMYVVPDTSNSNDVKLHVYSRRMDMSVSCPSDFSFTTANLDMLEYYAKSFFYDYDPEECSWLFDVYSVALNGQLNVDYLNGLTLGIDPIIDYEIEVDDMKRQMNKLLLFIQNIEVIPQVAEDDDDDDELPDLIPLSLEEMETLCKEQETTEKEKETITVPELALENIYDESADDVIFVQE